MTLQKLTEDSLLYGTVNLAAYSSGNLHYNAEPVNEEIWFTEKNLSASTTKTWRMGATVKPKIIWVSEASYTNNKTITINIYNSENTLIWGNLQINQGMWLQFGNSSHYVFPDLTLREGWKATLSSTVPLTNILVIASHNIYVLEEIFPVD
jgi:hypothetical protein